MSKRMSLLSAGHYVAGQQFCVEQAETEVSLGNNYSPGPLWPLWKQLTRSPCLANRAQYFLSANTGAT